MKTSCLIIILLLQGCASSGSGNNNAPEVNKAMNESVKSTGKMINRNVMPR